MPANLPPEFILKQRELKEARSIGQKIRIIKELIALAPKHKGTEKLLAQLKRKLAKLEEQLEKQRQAAKSRKSSRKTIKKVAPFIVIAGPPNSGKTTLFKLITGKGEPKPWAYSTEAPDTAVIKYKDAKLQFVDVPSFDQGLAFNADIVLLTVPDNEFLEKFRNRNLKVVVWNGRSKEEILEEIWEKLGLIRVYTEEGDEPILLPKGATVRDAAEEIHKDFVKYFEWARVRRGNKVFRVGLDFELQDGDIIKIKARV